jgi:hypothetical protein
MTVRSAHRRFGDHPLGDMRRAAPAIADEAQEGVFARLVEVELGDLLRPALNPGGVGRVLEVERRLRASPEGVAHRGQRRAGLVWRRDQVVRLPAGVRELDCVLAGLEPRRPEAVLEGLDLCRRRRQPASADLALDLERRYAELQALALVLKRGVVDDVPARP